MKYPLYGDLSFREDDKKTGNYLEDVMHYSRSHGAIFRPTTDDWRDNFPGDLVEIKYHPQYVRYRAHKRATCEWKIENWRLLVQGEDFFNSTMSFISTDLDHIRYVYLKLPVIITQADLRSRGFKYE